MTDSGDTCRCPPCNTEDQMGEGFEELERRLRKVAHYGGTHLDGLWTEAADAIASLRRRAESAPPGGEPTQAAAGGEDAREIVAQIRAFSHWREGGAYPVYTLRDDKAADLITAALTRARDEGRAEGLEEAAKIARNGCLVPPDGGSPTEAEARMCDDIADAIRARQGQPAPAGEGTCPHGLRRHECGQCSTQLEVK